MQTLKNNIDHVLSDFKNETGNTPFIQIPLSNGSNIYAKCEWTNPTGSIKDRTAYGLIKNARDKGDFHPGSKILEYSGGNLGKSLAEICYRAGVELNLVFSPGTSKTYKKSLIDFLKEKNANLIPYSSEDGFWGVMQHTIKMNKENPSYTFLYQHVNEANFNIHKDWTGEEIISQLRGTKLNAWVAAIGSGGTLMGVYEKLQEYFPSIELHPVSPAEQPYGTTEKPNTMTKLSGTSGLGYGEKQKFVERKEHMFKNHWKIKYEDALMEMERFYKETNIQIGSSAAANLIVSRKIAEQEDNFNVITVFPDKGSSEEWDLISNGL